MKLHHLSLVRRRGRGDFRNLTVVVRACTNYMCLFTASLTVILILCSDIRGDIVTCRRPILFRRSHRYYRNPAGFVDYVVYVQWSCTLDRTASATLRRLLRLRCPSTTDLTGMKSRSPRKCPNHNNTQHCVPTRRVKADRGRNDVLPTRVTIVWNRTIFFLLFTA